MRKKKETKKNKYYSNRRDIPYNKNDYGSN